MVELMVYVQAGLNLDSETNDFYVGDSCSSETAHTTQVSITQSTTQQ